MFNTTYIFNKSLIPDDILSKLILLYGYNFDLQKQIKTPINPFTLIFYKNLYAINSAWLTKFKEFYNYESLSKILQQKLNLKSYDDFEININKLTEIIKTYKIYEKDKDFRTYLNNIPFFPAKNNVNNTNFYYYNDFYIVNQKIRGELHRINYNKGNRNEQIDYKIISNLKCIYYYDRYSFIFFGNEI